MLPTCFVRSNAKATFVQDDKTLRIFNRKNYYSVHGPETAVVAKLFGANGDIKQQGKVPNQLPYITLYRSRFEQLLRHVLVEQANKVVELYEGHGTSWRIEKCARLHHHNS